MRLSDETLHFIEKYLHEDVRALALRSNKPNGVDLPVALTQIAGHQAAMEKLPTWSRTPGILYPRHLSLEQCSSEATARYKAQLVSGVTFADLTGGFGVDCYFLSTRFQHSAYIERQEELCEIALHNFALLNREDITVHHGDGIKYLRQMETADCLFIDPARRDTHGGKTVAISDCEPNIKELEELLLQKASTVLIKLSPMLDIVQTLRDLPSAREVHILSVHNECKELLLVLSGKAAEEGVRLHCVNLMPRTQNARDTSVPSPRSALSTEKQLFIFTPEEEANASCTHTGSVEKYLYEPNASIMKAGGYRSLAQRYGLKKLHPNSHLYTSSRHLADFPGRRFEVEQTYGFSKKELKTLSALKQANLTVRNFPSPANELRKRLKLNDGGETYLFATTLADNRKVLLQCRKT